MLIIPAIDLKDEKVVRLQQGRIGDVIVYSDEPLVVAKKWVDAGAKRIHVVDLNGAFEGKLMHSDIINKLAFAFPQIEFEIGGGIRDRKTLRWCPATLAKYFILGTAAVTDPDFVLHACESYPSRIILGLDAKDGMVATEGWNKVSHISAENLLKRFEGAKIESVIYTDISKDGMLRGMNFEQIKKIAASSPFPIIASGGLTSLEDVKKLKKIPNVCGVIAGKAIYEGLIDLKEAIRIAAE